MMDNQRVLDNLRHGLTVLEAFPPERIDLYQFAYESPVCGTCYCAAGLMAIQPFFHTQGMAIAPASIKSGCLTTVKPMVFVAEVGLHQDINVIDKLFGDSAYRILFETRGCGWHDDELLADIHDAREVVAAKGQAIGDHELVIARFKNQIAYYESKVAKHEQS